MTRLLVFVVVVLVAVAVWTWPHPAKQPDYSHVGRPPIAPHQVTP